jgi:hypothetical protein
MCMISAPDSVSCNWATCDVFGADARHLEGIGEARRVALARRADSMDRGEHLERARRARAHHRGLQAITASPQFAAFFSLASTSATPPSRASRTCIW